MRHHLARTLLIAGLAGAVVIGSPVSAAAQRYGYGGHSHVVIGVGFGFGYYHPFYPYYNPWFYPWASWGPYGAYGYWGGPYYGGPYPYGYGYGYIDDSTSVRLEVTPRETEVFVDGLPAGTVDSFDGFFQRLRLPPGDHDGRGEPAGR